MFLDRKIAIRSFAKYVMLLTLGRLDIGEELRWWFLTVALRVVVDPSPQVLAGLLHGQLRLPVELLVGQRRVCREIEHIALSAAFHLVLQITTDDLAEGIDNLVDGASTARSQIPCLYARLLFAEVIEGEQVTLGKVDDVDVIADGGAIAGRVV